MPSGTNDGGVDSEANGRREQARQRIVVVGAGAIGGYAGAMLARAGHDVVLVARGEHAARLESDGVVIEWPDETITVRTPVLRRVDDVPEASADVVLVAVKAKDLQEVAAKVGRVLAPGG